MEPSADEAGDDVDVESGALAEVTLVVGGEGGLTATVKAISELDGGVGARAEVKSTVLAGLDDALHLEVGGGTALVLLSVAVADASVNLARVGSVGASVVLDGARALNGGAQVLEGSTVGLEGAVGITGVLDGGGRATEVAAESLEVSGGGGRGRSLGVAVV